MMPSRTRVAEPRWALALMWLGFPLAGAGAGWLLLRLVQYAGRPWVPLPRSFKALGELSEPHATLGAVAIGALAGLALAYVGARESLAVTVSGDEVVLERGGSAQRIARTAVSAAFRDGKRLVLLGADGAELAREASDLPAGQLAAAFQAHGYPWRTDGDPYAAAFRRWVDGLPGLPEGADALFKARARALTKGDQGDAAELRRELARLGVVVRDEGKRQYWRAV